MKDYFAFRRRVTTTAMAIGIAIAASAMPSTPASANDGVCGPGDLCLYEHILLEGGRWDDSQYVKDYSSGNRWWGTDRSINDQASSARSRYSFFTAYIYEHSFWRGSWVGIYAGNQLSVLADFGMNDKASSNDY